MSPTIEANRKLLEHYYYRGWNRADEREMRQVLAEDVLFRGALGARKPKRGIDAFCRYMHTAHGALENYTCLPEDVVMDDAGKAAVRVMARGLHKNAFFGVEASGVEVSWSNAAFFKFESGKIKEIWVLGDVEHLKQQIGAGRDATPF